MPRYLKQPDHHSCGPIALMNALKFQGERVTLREDFKAWKDFCSCGIVYSRNRYNRKDWTRTKNGTTIRAFSRLARELGATRLLAPDMRKMHKKLVQGFALAVQVRYTRIHGHLFLITKTRKNAFYCVNLYEGETAGWITKKRFYKRHRKHTTEFRVWGSTKGISMPLMGNAAFRSRPVEDLLLYIKDSSIEEACDIIEALGRGDEDYFVSNDFMSGCYTIKEIAASYDGSLLAQVVDNIDFEGGPHKAGWFCGDLQKVLYDRVFYGLIERGPSEVADVVGLQYGV